MPQAAHTVSANLVGRWGPIIDLEKLERMHAGQPRLWTHAQGGAAAHRARMMGRSFRLHRFHGLHSYHSQHEVLQPPPRLQLYGANERYIACRELVAE